jgi:hypothetical protein
MITTTKNFYTQTSLFNNWSHLYLFIKLERKQIEISKELINFLLSIIISRSKLTDDYTQYLKI